MGEAREMLPRHGADDIDDLLRRDILVKEAAGGRSTSYSLREL